MYNNLRREDILDILDKIKISDYYRNKLKKITDEKKLRLEFSKLLDKYDKFIKLKTHIRSLIKKRNKLNRHKFHQKGGGKYDNIQTILHDLKNKLDSFTNNDQYISKLNELEKNINELTSRKLIKESQKLIEKITRDQEKNSRQFEEMMTEANFSKENIQKYKLKMHNLESQITNLSDLNIQLTEEMDKTTKKFHNEKVDLEGRYVSQISKLTLLNEQLGKDMGKIKLEKMENDKIIATNKDILENKKNLAIQQVELLKQKIKECSFRNTELDSKFNDIRNCEVMLNNKKNEIINLTSKFDHQSKELNEMKNRVKNSEFEIQELNKDLIHKKVEIEDINNRNGELEAKRIEVQKKLDECIANANISDDEFKSLQERMNKLNDGIKLKKLKPGEKLPKISKETLEEMDILSRNNDKIMKEMEDMRKEKERVEQEKEDIISEIKNKEEEASIVDDVEQQIRDEEEEEKQQTISDEKLGEEDTPGKSNIEDELRSVDLIQTPSDNRGKWLLNEGENLRKKVNHLKNTALETQKINEYFDNQNEKLDELNDNFVKNDIPNEIQKAKQIYEKTKFKPIDDIKIAPDLFTDSDFQNLRQRGGSHHKKNEKKIKGSGKSFNQLMSRLNYNINNIRGNTNNYDFVKNLKMDFTNHVNKYEQSLGNFPSKILKRMSKGVIILYIRLLEDIMLKWEDLGWLKIVDDFFDIEFEKVYNGDEHEIKKMNDKISSYRSRYQKPNFDTQVSHISEEVGNKLQEFWDDYYIMVRRWYNILQYLSNKIKGDQVIVMDVNENTRIYFNNFNILREKLDDYQVLTRKPVSVYARINDIGRDESGFKNTQSQCDSNSKDFNCKKVKSDDYVMFGVFENKEYKNFLNLNINQCTSIQSLKSENPNLFKKFQRYSQLDNATKFDEIFFTAEFSNNKTISRYMLLDKLIAGGIGVFLVTYGYSGVGKSFTLFGNDDNPGLLQSTIANISNIVNTKLRIYEVYGLGLPYSDGYENLENINQELIHYNLQISSTTSDITLKSTTTRKFNDIGKYINKIQNIKEDKMARSDDRIFLELPTKKDKLDKSLKSISRLISKIDSERRSDVPARVKPTVNNPDSSRSILIYDFIFTVKLDNGELREVSFVIDDMPGLEDPIKTYILENKKKIIFNGPKDVSPEVKTYLKKNYFTNALKYVANPMRSYQELLLMSVLINPLYLSLLKPNDICYYFNQQDGKFRELVLDMIDNNLKIQNNKIVFNNINGFKNKLLNDKDSVILENSNNFDKDVSKVSLDLMESIIKVCIDRKNFNPMIDILAKILIDSKIPSNPTFNEEIILSKEDLGKINSKFQRKLLAPFLLEFLFSRGASQLNVDTSGLSRYQDGKNKARLVQGIIKGTAWNVLKKYVKKNVNSLNDIVKKMMTRSMKTTTIKSNISREMRNLKDMTYGGYVKAMLKVDKNTNIAYEIVKQVELYKKKQNTIYADLDKMKGIVYSFVQIAFEAWYINQNIAGVLKYYSTISNIQPHVINNYVQKQNLAETSLASNKELILNHINNLYDDSGFLVNLNVNFERIFSEIKNNTHSTKLFQTQSQEENNQLIVRDVINPYTEGDKPRIQDFKMFYVLSNNSTQLKCLNQAELFLNTREFIKQIGEN